MSVKATLRKATVVNTGSPGAQKTDDFDKQLGATETIEVSAEVVGEGDTQEGADAASQVSSAVTTRSSSAVGRPQDFADTGLSGEWNQDDVKLPRLVIVNGSGPLSQEYPQGTLLYADIQLFGTPDLKDKTKNPLLEFVVIDIFPQYRENISDDERDNEVSPRVVNTREEAEALGAPEDWLGGVFEYIDGNKPRWQRSARVLLLVKEPENCDHPGFSVFLDGTNWAPAVYYASGTAWDGIKTMANTIKGSHWVDGKPFAPKALWTAQVYKKTFTKFGVFLFGFTPTKKVSGEGVRDYIKTLKAPAAAAVHAE